VKNAERVKLEQIPLREAPSTQASKLHSVWCFAREYCELERETISM